MSKKLYIYFGAWNINILFFYDAPAPACGLAARVHGFFGKFDIRFPCMAIAFNLFGFVEMLLHKRQKNVFSVGGVKISNCSKCLI